MKKKLLFVFIFVLITCCGCSGKYTLTYVDDSFSEEFVLEDTTGIENEVLVRYTDGSEYLKIDDNGLVVYKDASNFATITQINAINAALENYQLGNTDAYANGYQYKKTN